MTDNYQDLDDGRLVERTLAGDRTAFGCLYDRHQPRVRAVVWRAAENAAAVDDLVQECFLRAYDRLEQLRPPYDGVGPWLLAIARRVAKEKRRSLVRDRHRFMTVDPLDQAAPEAAAQDEVQMVLDRMGQLSENQRLALELFFLERRNATTTAELLGMSRSGFYALLKRACRDLARLVQRDEPVREEH